MSRGRYIGITCITSCNIGVIMQINIDNGDIIVAITSKLNKFIGSHIGVGFASTRPNSSIIANRNHGNSSGESQVNFGIGSTISIDLEISSSEGSSTNISRENCVVAVGRSSSSRFLSRSTGCGGRVRNNNWSWPRKGTRGRNRRRI